MNTMTSSSALMMWSKRKGGMQSNWKAPWRRQRGQGCEEATRGGLGGGGRAVGLWGSAAVGVWGCGGVGVWGCGGVGLWGCGGGGGGGAPAVVPRTLGLGVVPRGSHAD